MVRCRLKLPECPVAATQHRTHYTHHLRACVPMVNGMVKIGRRFGFDAANTKNLQKEICHSNAKCQLSTIKQICCRTNASIALTEHANTYWNWNMFECRPRRVRKWALRLTKGKLCLFIWVGPPQSPVCIARTSIPNTPIRHESGNRKMHCVDNGNSITVGGSSLNGRTVHTTYADCGICDKRI